MERKGQNELIIQIKSKANDAIGSQGVMENAINISGQFFTKKEELKI